MTNLPELPRVLKRREADFGIEFRRWWEKHPIRGNFELKHTRGSNSLPFSSVEDEQLVVGKAANSRKGILLRLTVGTTGAPDYVGQIEQPVWIVIRYPRAFYVISINTFLLEKSRSKRKSLTSERAAAIATISAPC